MVFFGSYLTITFCFVISGLHCSISSSETIEDDFFLLLVFFCTGESANEDPPFTLKTPDKPIPLLSLRFCSVSLLEGVDFLSLVTDFLFSMLDDSFSFLNVASTELKIK